MENIQNAEVINNEAQRQFEIQMNGFISKIPYNIKDDMMALLNTEVPDELKGRGVASILALYALNYAKDHHLKISTHCPFITRYIKEHPEWKSYVKNSPTIRNR